MSRLGRLLVTTIVALFIGATTVLAQSTVNPTVPAANSQLSSSPIRSNFAAAYNDINGLLGMHAVSLLANCSLQTTTVGADCLVMSSPTTYLWYKYTGANGYVLVATINPSTSPPSIAPVFAPIANGSLVANCSGTSPANPTGCTWSNFADQAITNVNGSLPYRTGGAWSIASTGISGHVIPFLDASNIVFSNPITSGVAGTSVGQFCMANATSGAVCLAPTTGALGSSVATFPVNSGIVAELNLAQTWTAYQTFSAGATVGTQLVATGPVTAPSLALGGATIGSNVLAVTGTSNFAGNLTASNIIDVGTLSIQSASAQAFAVGLNGVTNPAFSVDASTALQVAGLNVTGAVTGGTVALSVIDSGSSTNLSIDAKGTGTIVVGGVSTGAITLTRATTISAALTYGGVTLSNAVTGTGNMVLSTSPTLGTPTLTTPVINGISTGTGVAAASTANTLVLRDASGNVYSNNTFYGTTATASAGGTTTLSVASTRVQQLTGTLAQTYKLPDATTLQVGTTYEFDNNSTGLLTIVDNSSGAISTAQGGAYARVTNTANGTAAGTWDTHFFLPKTVQWGNTSLSTTAWLTSTSTTAPASAAGNTNVVGTISAPTLSNNGQAFLYNTTTNGAVVQGQGSTLDVALVNKIGQVALGVTTNTQDVVLGGALTAASLSTSGTIAGSLCRTSGGLILYEVGINCFATAATSIAPGTTTISPSTNNTLLYNNSAVVGQATVGGGLSLSAGALSLASQAAFSAGLTASQTGVASSTSTQVLYNTTTYNIGGFFNTGTSQWTPPAGTVVLDACIYATGTLSTAGSMSTFIFKNGVAFAQAINDILTSQGGNCITLQDRANGTDTYRTYVNVPTTAGTATLPNGILNFFQGHWVSP